MADNEDDKKLEEEDAPPPESILEEKEQRDPDEAVFAEQAIHHYAEDVLTQFRDGLENALGAFTSSIESQNDPETLNNSGFNAQIGQAFLQEMMSACGGHDTPIGAALFEELDSQVDEAVREEGETSYFLQALASRMRDFTWYLRDNLQSVLSAQWDELRDLAYEGSTDFIPLLHAFGMPRPDWSPAELSSTMLAVADNAKAATPKTEEEAVEKDPKQEEEEQQQLLLDEEAKKQAV